MLLESGDLIPVRPEAVDIPWTRRKTQILNFLHRGQVDFKTFVYDTNVGDIAPLATYFNPEKWTVADLNFKFGVNADSVNSSDKNTLDDTALGNDKKEEAKSISLQPRLLLYPELVRHQTAAAAKQFSISPRKNARDQGNRVSSSKLQNFNVPPPVWCPNHEPLVASKLPTPPKKSPPKHNNNNREEGGQDEHMEPIGPPKKRKMQLGSSSSDALPSINIQSPSLLLDFTDVFSYPRSGSLTTTTTSPPSLKLLDPSVKNKKKKTKERPVSTSSAWKPLETSVSSAWRPLLAAGNVSPLLQAENSIWYPSSEDLSPWSMFTPSPLTKNGVDDVDGDDDDDDDDDDDSNGSGGIRDEQDLVRSLRKIAKTYEKLLPSA